jgi:hypothetical protein
MIHDDRKRREPKIVPPVLSEWEHFHAGAKGMANSERLVAVGSTR